ncbi:MAG: phosphoenolpyruvate--protein phosphotransferase [Verrucomicrobiota bacterium]|nr:phosphoenolpyruvate--protein phosphotransferase [Verrucomicrobiota bacterium]
MALEQHFVCPLPNGVHARPASVLEEVVRGFESEVTLLNQRTRRAANGKSVLAIVGADIRHWDPCLFTISGPDEREAMAALTAFLQNTFPRCDEPLLPAARRSGELRLSPCLRNAGATVHGGVSLVRGIARGRLVPVGKFSIPRTLPRNGVTDPETEWRQLDAALAKLKAAYDERLAVARGIENDLIKVHRSIARDVEFRRRLREAVMARRRTAAGAIEEAAAHFTGLLAASGSALLYDRALDIQDVCAQLLQEVYDGAAVEINPELTEDSLVVAEALTPGQFLALNRKFLKGLVLADASATSHTVILARSFNLPTLAGVEDLATLQSDGGEAVLDGDAGVLVTQLTDAARRYYAMEQRRLAGRRARLQKAASLPATTRDGRRIEIAANIATADEAAAAFDGGAEGIGLFRTEMLFLDRNSPPDETEQFEVYRRVLEAAGNRPVIVRTLDAGGDKRVAYLNLPAEENPFLGRRAVRIYPEFEPLFRTQLRALIRASAFGKLRVMVPMVALPEEVRWVKKVIAEEQSRCAAEKLPFDAAMPVGAMIEVPAAAFAMEALCRELDFFSIGSNDLLQYFMAADRMNTRLAALHDPLQPAFLRLLKQIADAARARQKEIGLCGEMGGQTRFLPLLTGLGLNKISAAAPVLAGLKTELAGLSADECRQLLDAALHCATAEEAGVLLEEFASRHGLPLLDPDLIIADSDAATREEAIKQAVDRLFVLGRTEEPLAVEEAVWQREAAYSTGFGNGFAIPHCKTNAMRFSSLALLKPRAPVAWRSLDGQPVRVMILLAVREDRSATEHMKILARLARRLMDGGFRTRLERESDPAKLCAILQPSFES